MLIGCKGKPFPHYQIDPFHNDDHSDSLPLRVERGDFTLFVSPTGVPTLDAGQKVYRNNNLLVAFQGHIFNLDNLRERLAVFACSSTNDDEAAIIAYAYSILGNDLFGRLNGSFALVIFEIQQQCLTLVRDHLGVEPLYYARNGDGVFFSTSLQDLADLPEIGKRMNLQSLYRYLIFNYNLGMDTFFAGIRKLPPGFYATVHSDRMELHRYWNLSFKADDVETEEVYREALLYHMREAVEARIKDRGSKYGVFISGGLDSSSVAALMEPELDSGIHTYTFRCRGKSYDESRYARIVSQHVQTYHHELDFTPSEITNIEQLTDTAEEPFSDIGVETAFFLLGRYAGRDVSCVLTGDGGDELFAGHPVYIADRYARVIDRLPDIITYPATRLLNLIPDREEKQDLFVRLRRFSYSHSFPRELYSNRWRVYYRINELKDLCSDEVWYQISDHNVYSEVENIYRGSDASDQLSKSLYGDYFTIVDFYLRRMQALRRFGIEVRFPLLDIPLVELAAQIPSRLKTRSGVAAKNLLRRAMRDVLPEAILKRRDKLGNTIPMKNWMRESASAQEFLQDNLNDSTLARRGLFSRRYVQKLLIEHQRRTHNHCHRLWALLTLELWLQRHLDPAAPSGKKEKMLVTQRK